jgi:chemotaxis protein methyltransferase CheR
MRPIAETDFKKLQQLIYSRFGIVLGDKKKALMNGRLYKILRLYGLSDYSELYEYILNDTTGRALSLLADQISTNHTFFYREKEHFHYMVHHALPEILRYQEKHLQKEIRIWSAGCSSGEETYTIAIFLKEFLEKQPISGFVGVLGTDISTQVLQTAQLGRYSAENVSRLPKVYLHKYFKRLKNGYYEVKPILKQIVLFRRLNLIRPQFPFKHRFHIIFCRNVMIYFDHKERSELIRKFSESLVPGGYLFIGHSESIGRQNPYFRYIQPAIYQNMKEA